MKMLKGEKVLLESTNGVLVLTTHRVRHNWDQSCFTSTLLEEVCSIELTSFRFLWLMVLGLAVFGAGMVTYYRDVTARGPAEVIIMVGVLLVIAYFMVQRRVLAIESAGAAIKCPVSLFARGSLSEDFAHALEAAKDERYRLRSIPGEAATG